MAVFVLQDRRFQTLTHSSVSSSNVFCPLAVNLRHSKLERLHSGAGGGVAFRSLVSSSGGEASHSFPRRDGKQKLARYFPAQA